MNFNLVFNTIRASSPEELTRTFLQSLQTEGGLTLADGRTLTVEKKSVKFEGIHPNSVLFWPNIALTILHVFTSL